MIKRVLIANRGEIAIRIARSAADVNIEAVMVYSTDDAQARHCHSGTHAIALAGRGARAYLDRAALITAMREAACDAIHPGYGFVSESAAFAQEVIDAGLTWIGPTPKQLALFGNKVAARALAQKCSVPIIDGSAAINNAQELANFSASISPATVVIKAAAGGGGRGMQVISPEIDPAAALTRCAEEARAAFGDGTLYAERYLSNARHIEVQVLGDTRGNVVHLWERDCSLQRRHQKLIEIAPAPALPEQLRGQLTDAACRMAGEVKYQSLGTFEFLVDVAANAFWFIEANPRIQVEHTITEEILGLDLVALQFAIANGASLQSLGLAAPPTAPRTSAIQLRVNSETLNADSSTRPSDGVITRFDVPGGPGIRIDSAGYVGYAPNPGFDSMMAKLIVRERSLDFAALCARAERAAADFRIEGLATNLPLLRAALRQPAVREANLHTRYIEQHAGELSAAALVLAPTEALTNVHAVAKRSERAGPPGTTAIVTPLRASVVSIDVTVGAKVARGAAVAVLEAMKMHHVVEATVAGEVAAIVAASGETLAEGEALVFITPDATQTDQGAVISEIDLDAPRADLDEVNTRHALGLDKNRPESVAKRRRTHSRTARENVDDLCDPNSFIEYGALTIAAQRRRRTLDDLQRNTPADGMVAGIGTVNAAQFDEERARCMVFAYDYTVLAGTQGAMNHKKKDRLFELAQEWKLPIVFFTEGGGGRPGDVDVEDIVSAWLDLMTFSTWPQLSGLAPRIAVNSGRCFAGNAVIFGCADITIATKNSNIGLAGPAMIEGGGLGRFTPEDIGPIAVQTENGVVDLAVADEAEGTAAARQLLAYFQGRWPDWTCADQRRLRHLIPENRLRVYDIRAVIETLADSGSVIELRRDYGIGIITAFVRIEGEAFGLIANNSCHLGGAIDGPGAEKGARFLQLCDTYGLPIISLCDTPGFMVGPDSEKTAAVRRGSRLILASANLTVPLFTVVLRKGYGLGAQAMAGGSFHRPYFTISWPTGEFGPMGLEGAVNLGFRKELEAETDPTAKQALFERLLNRMYTTGKAVSVASQMEVDAVIDPVDTRAWLIRGRRSAGPIQRGTRRYVDVW